MCAVSGGGGPVLLINTRVAFFCHLEPRSYSENANFLAASVVYQTKILIIAEVHGRKMQSSACQSLFNIPDIHPQSHYTRVLNELICKYKTWPANYISIEYVTKNVKIQIPGLEMRT